MDYEGKQIDKKTDPGAVPLRGARARRAPQAARSGVRNRAYVHSRSPQDLTAMSSGFTGKALLVGHPESRLPF